MSTDAPWHRSDKTQKKLADDAKLLRIWRRFHAEEKAQVLAGPHATTLAELFRMFANLQHVQPAQLVGFIGAINWSAIDYQTRLTVLHEVNNAITANRVKRGLEPIDNNLPGQPDTPFRAIKAILFPHVADVALAEAQLGSDTETPRKTGHVT
jgi:hypothetical protein